MTQSFSSLGTLFVASVVALLPVACAGKILPNSGGETPLETVSVNAVGGPIIACGDGYAHPNVCCEEGDGKASSCGVYEGAPFHACDPGRTTYPDPRSCCSLAGSGADCIAPPPPTPIPPPICGYACPVGQYQPPGVSSGTCCFTDGDVTTCSAQSEPACVVGCACPACAAGEVCPPCNCPEEPACPPPAPTPECNACPAGWQVPAGEPYLCCNEGSGGVIECFSQGVPPSPTPAVPEQPGGSVGSHSTH